MSMQNIYHYNDINTESLYYLDSNIKIELSMLHSLRDTPYCLYKVIDKYTDLKHTSLNMRIEKYIQYSAKCYSKALR